MGTILYYTIPFSTKDGFHDVNAAKEIEADGFSEAETFLCGGVELRRESDGQRGDVSVAVEIDPTLDVAAYEAEEAIGHGIAHPAKSGLGGLAVMPDEETPVECTCGLKFSSGKEGRAHLNGLPQNEFEKAGYYLIPPDILNAHTVSRRMVVEDFEMIAG